LDTKNTDLILEIKDLERDMERLESVLEDKDTEIEELNEKLASVRIGV
jgi:phage host-nuclease inhibitor protein Gam